MRLLKPFIKGKRTIHLAIQCNNEILKVVPTKEAGTLPFITIGEEITLLLRVSEHDPLPEVQ